MSRAFAKLVMKVIGWTADPFVPPEKKCVILGVPHTCLADFIVAYAFYASLGHKAYIMIKKEFFWGLHGIIMKKMGCIPTDRSNGATVVRSVVTAVNSAEGEMHLCLAPEGTRSLVKRWKAGYHTIAKALDCPVYAGYFNWATKHVGIMPGPFPLTDDPKADTKRLQEYYETLHLGARHPEKYFTV